MNAFKDRLERIQVEEPVQIPTLDGTGIAETVTVKVPAWRDPKDGEVYLDTEATAILDKVKARHMGLLTPDQIRAMRERMGLTQKQVSELLQIGEKTWTRWETGRERPSRSINVLLFALNEGKIDAAYLRSLARRRNDWALRAVGGIGPTLNPWLRTVQEVWQGWEPEAGRELAEAVQRAIAEFFVSRGGQKNFGFKIESRVTFATTAPSNIIRMQPAKPVVPASRLVRPAEVPTPRVPNLEHLAA